MNSVAWNRLLLVGIALLLLAPTIGLAGIGMNGMVCTTQDTGGFTTVSSCHFLDAEVWLFLMIVAAVSGAVLIWRSQRDGQRDDTGAQTDA